MLHIAAGVFLGLIAYTIAIGWWAGRPARQLARELRRSEKKQRLQDASRRWAEELERRRASAN